MRQESVWLICVECSASVNFMYLCPEGCLIRIRRGREEIESNSVDKNLAVVVCGGCARGLRAGTVRRWRKDSVGCSVAKKI